MPALRLIAFAVLAMCSTLGHAVGLGAIRVQSGLGQPLRATIPLLGGDNNDVGDTCVKAKLESLDGAFIVAPKASLSRGAAATSIVLSSLHDVNEPAVTLAVEIGCTTPIQRSYQLLLDPPAAQPLLMPVPKPAGADAGANDSRQDARFPLAAADIPADTARAPWNDKYLLRKKPRAGSGKPHEAGEKPALTRAPGRMGAHDVLRISDESVGTGARLRLSDSLSESIAVTDPAKAEENRAAQQRFAALLRGEDPIAIAEDKERVAQSRLQALQAETAKYRQQTKSDKSSLDAMRAQSFTPTFVFSLGGLLLLSLSAVGWLAWRLRSNKADSTSGWWEGHGAAASEPVLEQKPAPRSHQLSPAAAPVVEPEVPLFETMADQGPDLEALMPSQAPAEAAPMAATVPPPQESPSSIAINPFAAKVASLKVEEISDVTQEAEFWMSLNDPQRALEILETQSEVERPVSPVPWLYLLDLYRDTGNRDKYEALRTRFKRLFNALIPEFDEPKETNPRTLEDFPHLMKRICETWGGPGSLPFLESLLVDDRDGARVGFELPVYRDILLLIGIASEWKHSGLVAPLLPEVEPEDDPAPDKVAPLDFNPGLAAPLLPDVEPVADPAPQEVAPLDFNSGLVELHLPDVELTDHPAPQEVAPLDFDLELPEIAVPEIVPPLGAGSTDEGTLVLEDINFEPMDFGIDITPKTAPKST